MDKIDYIICSCCDNDYLPHLEKLVASAGMLLKNVKVHLALVNVPEPRAAYLKVLNPRVEFDFDYIYFASETMKRGYCTNRKPSLMLSIMNKNPDIPVVWVDADSVITTSMDQELKDLVTSYDLTTILDSNHHTFKKTDKELKKCPMGPLGTAYFGVFSAGVIGTRNSEISKKFFKRVLDLVNVNPYAWFSDQEALYLTYLEFKDRITFSPMSERVACEGRFDSIISFAKGARKDGPFKDIGNSIIWKMFNMAENIPIDESKIAICENNITNIKLTYKLKNLIISLMKRLINGVMNMAGLKGQTFGTFLNRIDWIFSKSLLRKRYIRRNIRDFSMYLDTKVAGISRTLAIYRKREEDMTELICRVLKPGMTVMDCGSNIGYYPLLEASAMKGSGKIICIEPDPRNFDLLKKNLTSSNFPKIFDVNHLAISDKKDIVPLNIAEYSNLNKVIRGSVEGANIYNIESDSIDNLVEKNGWELDFLRMDIEGHEVEVFRGARNSFMKFKKGFIVFLEVHPNEYSKEHSFEEELRFLLNNGYQCKYLVSAGVPMPALYAKLGYSPSEVIKSDGLDRGIYNNITDSEHIISLVCDLPKSSRYIMLEKVRD